MVEYIVTVDISLMPGSGHIEMVGQCASCLETILATGDVMAQDVVKR